MTDHFAVQTATPEDAAKRWQCPMGRTFADPGKMCRGAACAAWRFLPMNAEDPAIKAAIQREAAAIAEERGKKLSPIYHQEAVKRVMADPSAYAIPAHHERGYCGLAGRP